MISDRLYAIVKDDLTWHEEEKKKEGMTQVATTEAVADEFEKREGFATTSCNERRGSMTNRFKAYSNDEDRYIVTMKDHFDQNSRLFIERYDQADIPEIERHRAF